MINDEIDKETRVVARVLDIDQFGLLKLKFTKQYSEKEAKKLGKELFSKKHMIIGLLPSPERAENPEFDYRKLEINSWSLLEFDNESRIAHIQLNFSEPLQISQETN